jgi:hypothetical protein
MQTFVPLPGHDDKAALIAGSSSVIDLADASFDVFDAATSTFRYREPGAATATSTPVG